MKHFPVVVLVTVQFTLSACLRHTHMIDSYNQTENKFLKIEEIVFRIKMFRSRFEHCTARCEQCSQENMFRHCRFLLIPPKKSLLKSSYPKKYLPNFRTQKNPGIENFKLKKLLRSSPSLEIPSTPPPPLLGMRIRSDRSWFFVW